MPKRPPKHWFKDCTEGVEESGSADDPKAVCGDLWHNKMSEEDKREIVREEESRKRKKKHKK